MNKTILNIFIIALILLIGVSAVNAIEYNASDEITSFNQNEEIPISTVNNDDLNIENTDYNTDTFNYEDNEVLTAINNNNSEELSVENSNDEAIATSDNNDAVLNVKINDNEVNISSNNKVILSASIEEKVSLVNSATNHVSFCSIDNSKISSSDSQPKVSMSISNQTSKLTSIYDKVYSHTDWKSILLTKFKVKKSWPKHKRDKKIRKYWKKAMKKVNKLVKKYTKKGWTYERRQWIWDVGQSKVTYWYYLQFTKTVYYNGYGERIA